MKRTNCQCEKLKALGLEPGQTFRKGLKNCFLEKYVNLNPRKTAKLYYVKKE